MVMMLQYCDCCQKEKWFKLQQVALVGNSTTLKYVWQCSLCNWEIDYHKPETALEEYLDDLLHLKGDPQ